MAEDASAADYIDVVIGRLLDGARDRVSRVQNELASTMHKRREDLEEHEEVASRLLRERDSSGSRFYSQPGFAILLGEDGNDPSGYDGDTGDAMARVRSALGSEPAPDAELGQPLVRNAAYGRGAAGWTAVVEWTLEAAAEGIVGLIAAAPIVAAGRRYVAVKRRMQARGADFLINRAGALLVALEDVLRDAPGDSRLWLESAEEISTVAGRPLTELNHVGADPWIVFIVDLNRDLRYVRIVSPVGDITGRTTTSLTDLERLYLMEPD